ILNEAADVFEYVIVGCDDVQDVAFANGRSRGAADVDLPFSALDGHRAHILDHGFGAVPRATCGSQLHFMRAVEALEFVFDFHRQGDAVAQAEATEICADATLASAI